MEEGRRKGCYGTRCVSFLNHSTCVYGLCYSVMFKSSSCAVLNNVVLVLKSLNKGRCKFIQQTFTYTFSVPNYILGTRNEDVSPGSLWSQIA